MIEFRFTMTPEGMFVKSHTDVGWLEHMNCAGDMYLEYTVPYDNDKAVIYFGSPYDLQIVGEKATQTPKVGYHYGSTAVLMQDGSTLVLQLERQPSMKFQVANVPRN